MSAMRGLAEDTQEAFASGNPENLQQNGGEMLQVGSLRQNCLQHILTCTFWLFRFMHTRQTA